MRGGKHDLLVHSAEPRQLRGQPWVVRTLNQTLEVNQK